MSEHLGPGPHPLIGRQRHLVAALRVAVGLALVAAFVGLSALGRPGELGAIACVVLLIATPLVRLVWLLLRWVRRRDHRFAGATVALLAVVMVAASTPWW
jgi:Kef-type K+ transport system membrane component KefB